MARGLSNAHARSFKYLPGAQRSLIHIKRARTVCAAASSVHGS